MVEIVENRFEANIILCEKIEEENSLKGIFNNIEIDQGDTTTFGMWIFLVADIKECKKETFLLDVIYKSNKEEDSIPINFLGSLEKTYECSGVNRELIVLKENVIEFKWEGMYTLEMRHCKKSVNINEASYEEMTEIINDSTVINSFTFSVEFEKDM